jgi:hypothetical protein
MESTRGQSQEPQDRPQRNKLTGTINGSQDPYLGGPSGRRSCVRENPELRSRPRASQSSGVSFFTRRGAPDFLLELQFLKHLQQAGWRA